MQISLTQIVAVVGLTVSVVGGFLGILAYFQRRYTPTALATMQAGFDTKFSEMNGEVEILKKQMGLFWNVVEKQMSTLLHSPHRPRLDQLLDKNTRGESLTDGEADLLVNLLQKLIDTKELSKDEISYATLLMAVTVAKYRLES